MASAISTLAWMAQWTLIFGGHRDDREGGVGALGMVGMLVMMIVMPLAASLVQFAISRTREYSADETGARILRNPLPLANALEKLEAATRRKPLPATKPNEAMAHMYIVNPLGSAAQHAHETGGGFVNLFSTHPPIAERVRRLREMVLAA
jgi:heat shock protein HtpX